MEDIPAPRPKGNYSTYRRLAYSLKNAAMPSQTLWQAKFPAPWEVELNALAQYISQKDRTWYIPYQSLAKVLLLAIPSGITFGFDSIKVNNAYIRAFITAIDAPPETAPVTTIVRGWANFEIERLTKRGNATYAEIHSRLNNILNEMSPAQLNFQKLKVDLPLDPEGPGLSAENEGYFYKALPAWIVKQLQDKEFEVGGRNFRMIRAQQPYGRGLELVSWPPQQFGKGYLSLVLTIEVRTLPGKSDHPVIYPKLSVRRWVHKPLLAKNKSALPSNQSTSVMLRTDVPWLPDLTLDSQALATTGIRSQRNAAGVYMPAWDDNLPDLLKAIGATPLISAEEFAQYPLASRYPQRCHVF